VLIWAANNHTSLKATYFYGMASLRAGNAFLR
jgi:hypothetical protein